MGLVHTYRLVGPLTLDTSWGAVLELNGEDVARILHFRIVTTTNSAKTVDIGIGGSGASQRIATCVVPALGQYIEDCVIVLNEGEALWAKVSAGTTTTFSAFGSLLTGGQVEPT